MPIKTQYTVVTGDTTSRIALRYQISIEELINANPQVYTPDRPSDGSLIYPGDLLNIPSGKIDELKNAQIVNVDYEDDLTIIIDNKKVPLPHEGKFIEYFDACSNSFSITYPQNKDLKNSLINIDIDDFKTKGLPQCSIYIGNEPILTGVIEVPSFTVTPSAVIQTLAGRNGTYLLEKSDMMPSVEREYLNQSLGDLSNIVAGKHSVNVEIQDGIDVSELFPKITIEDSEKPFFLISRLARERSLLTGNTGEGKLLIHKAVKSEPVANFTINQDFMDFIGAESLEFTFDTRELSGQYYGITSTPENANLTETVQSNELLEQSIKIFNFSDATEGNLKSTTEWEEQKAVRGFYNNALPYPSWINPSTGKRWKVGQTIILQNNDVSLKTKEMLIRSIEFILSSNDKKTCILNLIPVEVYL